MNQREERVHRKAKSPFADRYYILVRCATWQMPAGDVTRIEKHKTENARMQMPGSRLGDTIYSLRSGQAPHHFISYVWKQRQSFPATTPNI
jgi:hypothetical protein